MSKNEKLFTAFIIVWISTHIGGLLIVGHEWPGLAVDAGFMILMAMATSWIEFNSYRKKLK